MPSFQRLYDVVWTSYRQRNDVMYLMGMNSPYFFKELFKFQRLHFGISVNESETIDQIQNSITNLRTNNCDNHQALKN